MPESRRNHSISYLRVGTRYLLLSDGHFQHYDMCVGAVGYTVGTNTSTMVHGMSGFKLYEIMFRLLEIIEFSFQDDDF